MKSIFRVIEEKVGKKGEPALHHNQTEPRIENRDGRDSADGNKKKGAASMCFLFTDRPVDADLLCAMCVCVCVMCGSAQVSVPSLTKKGDRDTDSQEFRR